MKKRVARRIRPSFIVVTASVGVAALGASAATSGCSDSSSPAASNDASSSKDVTSSACPAEPPAFNAVCTGTVSCTYDAGMQCGQWLTSQAVCSNGMWQLSGENVGCNPGVPVADSGSDANDNGGDATSDGGAIGDAADGG
jgi:hypothetical protein